MMSTLSNERHHNKTQGSYICRLSPSNWPSPAALSSLKRSIHNCTWHNSLKAQQIIWLANSRSPSYLVHVFSLRFYTKLSAIAHTPYIFNNCHLPPVYICKACPRPSMYQRNPRLSELRAKQKVQIKVQISGTILICVCTVECSATIVRYACSNSQQR